MLSEKAYASAFVSFLLEDLSSLDINEVILFGSAAREETDKESDIDIFIDIINEKREKAVEAEVKNSLRRFYKSQIYEQWKLKGVKRDIQAHVGVLDKWALKRSIISNGITLYGRYKELPKGGLEQYTLFVFEPIADVTKRNRVIRMLFGRKEEGYIKEGLLEESAGKQLSQRCFYIPSKAAGEIIKFLNKENVDYRLFELWSDVF